MKEVKVQIFKAIYKMLGSPSRDLVKVRQYLGQGSAEGSSVEVALIKDLPQKGLTTFFTTSVSAGFLFTAEEYNEKTPQLIEYLGVINTELAESFIESELAGYIMKAANNSWPTNYGYIGQIQNENYNYNSFKLTDPSLFNSSLKPEFKIEATKQTIKLLHYQLF
jgi:hypothetical protein